MMMMMMMVMHSFDVTVVGLCVGSQREDAGRENFFIQMAVIRFKD